MSQPYPRESVYEQIRRANELGRVPEGIAAAEEAVRLADALEDVALGFEAREVLMENATFGGAPEKLLVAFSWCLGQADKDPNWQYDSWRGISLLWRYKWVIGNALDFPGIPRVRILAMLDDFRRRCLAAGYNERPACDLRFTIERRMGHFEAAREWLSRFRTFERDGLADCHACELDGIVAFYAQAGQHEDAIREAGAILQGRLRCAEIPHKTHSSLLDSYWAVGRFDEAANSHAIGYRLIRNGRAFVQQHGEHLHYLTRADNLEKAATLCRKHLPWALEGRSGEDRFRFLLAARAFLQRLTENGAKSIRIRLAPGLCPVAGKTTAPVRELLQWIETLLRDLAAQFDSRNESRWFSAQLEDDSGQKKSAA